MARQSVHLDEHFIGAMTVWYGVSSSDTATCYKDKMKKTGNEIEYKKNTRAAEQSSELLLKNFAELKKQNLQAQKAYRVILRIEKVLKRRGVR